MFLWRQLFVECHLIFFCGDNFRLHSHSFASQKEFRSSRAAMCKKLETDQQNDHFRQDNRKKETGNQRIKI